MREVAVFLGLTFAFSSGFYAYLLLSVPPRWGELQSVSFIWCPGLAAILTKLILRRPLSELGLRWKGTTRTLPGVIYGPYALAAVVYVTVWLTGLGAFDGGRVRDLLVPIGLGGLDPKMVLPPMLLVAAPLALLSTVSTLGEELGWRGLLAPGLAAVTSFTRASVVTGLVWSAWHYPIVFVLFPRMRPEVSVWYATACFTLTVVGVSFFHAWLRQASGSVWPCAFLHAACNGAQVSFEALTRDTGITHYFTFEYGIGFVIVTWTAAAFFFRRRPLSY